MSWSDSHRDPFDQIPAALSKLELLKPHPGTISGDPDELVHVDWSDQWQPVQSHYSETLC